MKDRPADLMGLSIKEEDNRWSLVSDAVVDGIIDVLSRMDDFSADVLLKLLLMLLQLRRRMRGFAIVISILS